MLRLHCSARGMIKTNHYCLPLSSIDRHDSVSEIDFHLVCPDKNVQITKLGLQEIIQMQFFILYDSMCVCVYDIFNHFKYKCNKLVGKIFRRNCRCYNSKLIFQQTIFIVIKQPYNVHAYSANYRLRAAFFTDHHACRHRERVGR